MGSYTNRIIGGAPQVDLYWLGEPSNYNSKDDLLNSFPAAKDLGGRYMGLVKGTTPQELFDVTVPTFKALHAEGIRKTKLSGQLSTEVVMFQATQMTWIFTVEHVNRLESRIEALEKQLQTLLERPTNPT